MAGKKDKVNIRGSISRFVIVALALVLILALAIWAIISLFTDSEEKTRYAFLNTGSINETLTADFLLLRNEDVIRSEHDGMFLPLKYEGEKLSKGEVFALILPESAADLVDSYQNTRLQILELSLSLSRDKILPNSRFSRSQSRIEEAVSGLRNSVLNRDIKALSLVRKEFAAVLQ
ncbi:MAG: HlyD family efflux transporter periplasmic adaptor subunit, partial [Eubacteriales bacterium]|nr:HlyD family efflux transporter periplasmic adaptor subunit [Eubacteriales bacterium]